MRKIVVIDDDDALRLTLKTFLEKNGFSVGEAKDGREGVRKVEELGPDVVLLDIIMPEQDGIETVQILRDAYPGIKVIAISGGGTLRINDLLDVARKLGAEGRLEKPFTCDQAMAEINRVLGF